MPRHVFTPEERSKGQFGAGEERTRAMGRRGQAALRKADALRSALGRAFAVKVKDPKARALLEKELEVNSPDNMDRYTYTLLGKAMQGDVAAMKAINAVMGWDAPVVVDQKVTTKGAGDHRPVLIEFVEDTAAKPAEDGEDTGK